MKVYCITHSDFETPGVIEDWAKKNEHSFMISRPYKGENCLENLDFDFLIIMGGPQSILEITKFPYLSQEIELIKYAKSENKLILGFCLGAQLIGEAYGTKTEKSPNKEVGIFPINLTSNSSQDPIFNDFPKTFDVIHWHNDMPGLTEQSKVLATSEGCPRQIVNYAKNIYGIQCHLEITRDLIKLMIEHFKSDLAPGKYIQARDQILVEDFPSINAKMCLILDKLVKNYFN